MIGEATESKALGLARYLKEFVGLRSVTVRDVDRYESVLWFGDIPQQAECRSPAWNNGYAPGDAWLEVLKPQFPKPPAPPEVMLPWIDPEAFKRATVEMPALRQARQEQDLSAELPEGEQAAPVERRVRDFPEVIAAYERFRPIWQQWSDEYRRREAVQTVYAELFHLHTQMQKQGEIVELVLGLGLLDWPGTEQKRLPIRRHVIVAHVSLRFDPTSGVIRLDAQADGARLRIEDDMLEAELRPERSQYAGIESQLKEIDEDIWNRASIFKAIKSWADALDPGFQWSPDLQPIAGDANRPSVSFAPALILRKRTHGGLARIYDSIICQLSSDEARVPSGWANLIDDDASRDASDLQPEADRPRDPGSFAPQEAFFPLPANREQRRIVEAIGRQSGVLVQGPPGTGKSHTIANLICHLLATGKRVLITAETGHALRVLKDKLPIELQPLCVSLLGQGGDAFAELNAAVQGITSRFESWSPGRYDSRIAEIDQEISIARRSMAELDTELLSLRAAETSVLTLPGGIYHGTPSRIAQRVAEERERYQWLGLPRDAAETPASARADLLRWLAIRRGYDDEQVAKARLRIVRADTLPSPEAFGEAVVAEREVARTSGENSGDQNHPAYRRIAALDPDVRHNLKSLLRQLDHRRRALSRGDYRWVGEVISAGFGGRQARWRALYDRSNDLIKRIEVLLGYLQSTAISIPPELDLSRVRLDADALASYLLRGGKWRRFGIIVPREVKGRDYLRHHVVVNGQSAATADQLQLVRRHVDIELAFVALEEVWRDHGDLPTESQRQIRLAAIKEQAAFLGAALSYVDSCLRLGDLAGADFPVPDWQSGEEAAWLQLIEAAELEERRQVSAQRVTVCLRSLVAVQDLPDAHPVINSLIQAVEARDITAYCSAHEALRRIAQTIEDEDFRVRVEAALATAVPGLVDAVARCPGDTAWDDRFNDWEAAWHWALADTWQRKRSDIAYQGELWQRRRELEHEVCVLLSEVVGLRAWGHFFDRLHSRPREMSALKAWREAVRLIGKGTGRSARVERLRREAREYMDQCRETIPIWIMPRYLVAEMIDPNPDRYDLIIVDEASQLGIDSLFLFYIAKRLIVVGDDQQISPYGVGISDEAIVGLQRQHLDGIPYQTALSAQSSLYGNAKIRFGQSVVLREHFRCMPEIIQFSNDLCYASNGTPLDPVRSYPPDRLQPLVVRHVTSGYRAGSTAYAINEPEADAVVAQVVACISDPRYTGRSMGVISLQGDAQARLIERKLLETLQPEVIHERRLICGDAYAFQGDERHIIFLSMVAAANERIGVLSNESARQRFNVAVSRAQDQLWLFHSVGMDVLSRECMRHRLLGYMQSPARQPTGEDTQRFESDFEQDVFRLVEGRGFHVRTQVCVGDPTNHRYRIDLVIEGMRGRMAVECDGEKWHGPERYEQDMARQRDLERAGWQFVRIRGGDFYRDRSTALEPLWQELSRLGIEPGGVDAFAAEPPAPTEFGEVEHEATDETTDADLDRETGAEGAEIEVKAARVNGQINGSYSAEIDGTDAAGFEPGPDAVLGEYVAYTGIAGPDPRTANVGDVADGLVKIIAVEGPLLARRAYGVYLRGCGIHRLGDGLKSTLNRALTSAVRQGRIVSENEPGARGPVFSTVRTLGSAPIRPRRRGPRTFEEIPPGELRHVGRLVLETRKVGANSVEHLRAVLEMFDLKRLTPQVEATLRKILAAGDGDVDYPLRHPASARKGGQAPAAHP